MKKREPGLGMEGILSLPGAKLLEENITLATQQEENCKRNELQKLIRQAEPEAKH